MTTRLFIKLACLVLCHVHLSAGENDGRERYFGDNCRPVIQVADNMMQRAGENAIRVHKTENDTLKENKIVNIYSNKDLFYVELDLSDKESHIVLAAYNIIGKPVKEIHNGKPLPEGTKYEFRATDLPNGIYLCILEGRNYRSVKKFIVSR